MHRHPPRHGAGRISRRGRAGARRAAGEDQGRRSARRGHAHGRAGQRRPARRRPRADRRAGSGRARASSSGDPNAEPPIAGGAFMPPVLLRTDDPWAHCRGARLSSRSARCRRSCPTATWPTRSRSPTAAWAASCCRCSPIRPRPRASSSRARRPITAGCWSSTATNAAESTGHGSPLPVLVHGGPGRAGGSEEMGGVRGRQALHAAHRAPVVAGDDRRDHRAIHPRRAQACRRRPPVPAER